MCLCCSRCCIVVMVAAVTPVLLVIVYLNLLADANSLPVAFTYVFWIVTILFFPPYLHLATSEM